MEENALNSIIIKAEFNERRAKKRAIFFILVPILVAVILLLYTSKKIITAQNELSNIEATSKNALKKQKDAEIALTVVKKLNDSLKLQNESLSKKLTESAINLGKAFSVTAEFSSFIDAQKPYLRTKEEASFFINYRMLKDRIRGNYEDLSQNILKLPHLDSNQIWVTVVKSSQSLEDLKLESNKLMSLYGASQVAIYKVDNMYTLDLKGNGTFTRAYRLMIELMGKYNFEGPYYLPSSNWGTDYLKY